jgi:hypothetical protein
MPDVPSALRQRLGELLLGYLQAAGFRALPGCDGMTVEDVLDAYPEAVATGKVPDWQQLLDRHPELDAEMQVWMAAKDRWQFAFRRDRLAEPGRQLFWKKWSGAWRTSPADRALKRGVETRSPAP